MCFAHDGKKRRSRRVFPKFKLEWPSGVRHRGVKPLLQLGAGAVSSELNVVERGQALPTRNQDQFFLRRYSSSSAVPADTDTLG